MVDGLSPEPASTRHRVVVCHRRDNGAGSHSNDKEQFRFVGLRRHNDIVVYQGTNPTVSGKTGNGGEYGIIIAAPTGSMTGNTFLGSQTGIALTTNGASVTSNNIYGAIAYAIDVSATALKKSTVEKNTIRNCSLPAQVTVMGIGIELGCNNISSSPVNSNTIADAFAEYGDAPAGFSGSNTCVGVFFDVRNGSGAGGSVNGKGNARPKLLGQSRGQ